jgi:hypothetical protein
MSVINKKRMRTPVFAYILRCVDTGAIINGNHNGTYLVFKERSAAEKEANYRNYECSTAPLRSKLLVEEVSLGGI